MKDYQSLSHTKWDCKYHVVFVPKYRRKRISVRFDNNWMKCFMSWQNRRRARL